MMMAMVIFLEALENYLEKHPMTVEEIDKMVHEMEEKLEAIH